MVGSICDVADYVGASEFMLITLVSALPSAVLAMLPLKPTVGIFCDGDDHIGN